MNHCFIIGLLRGGPRGGGSLMFPKVPQSSLEILRVPQLPPPLGHPLKNPIILEQQRSSIIPTSLQTEEHWVLRNRWTPGWKFFVECSSWWWCFSWGKKTGNKWWMMRVVGTGIPHEADDDDADDEEEEEEEEEEEDVVAVPLMIDIWIMSNHMQLYAGRSIKWCFLPQHVHDYTTKWIKMAKSEKLSDWWCIYIYVCVCDHPWRW